MKKQLSLFNLAWPIFIINILGTLLGFIDVYVLSRVNDLAASAVSTGCQITAVTTLLFSVVSGATGILVTQYLGSILYSHGETKPAMYLSVIMGVLNLVLDYIFVLGFHGFPALGVKGAALATLITKIVNAIFVSGILFVKIEKITVFGKLRSVKKSDVSGIFKLGIPSIFDSLNYNITQLLITGLILHCLGENEIIARTYLRNIALFFQLSTSAIASATQIMIGYAAGADDYNLVKGHCKNALKKSFVITAMISVIACAFSNQLFEIFTTNPEIIALGKKMMIANVALELGRVINVIYVWSLRGVGDVSVPVFICVACMWIVAVGGSWFALQIAGYGIIMVIIIAGLDEWIRGILMHMRWKSEKWIRKII